MDVLRTADDRFASLPGYPFEPHYLDVDGLRMHYVDEGPRDAMPVLLLHGEPSWSYLYRTIIPSLVQAGFRTIAPDLVGFGRSDKPADEAAHTYAHHVGWTAAVLDRLDLRNVALVGQDWGGLIGLRLVAEHGDRFAAVVAANTGLPTGDHPMPEVWWKFHNWVAEAESLPVGFLIAAGCVTTLPDEVTAAYEAPFPDETYKAGPRVMPRLVPTAPDDPAAEANRAAWQALSRWDKPFLCAFSDQDPITRDAAPLFVSTVPGAAGRDHPTISGAGHFLQEDAGPDLAAAIIEFLNGV